MREKRGARRQTDTLDLTTHLMAPCSFTTLVTSPLACASANCSEAALRFVTYLASKQRETGSQSVRRQSDIIFVRAAIIPCKAEHMPALEVTFLSDLKCYTDLFPLPFLFLLSLPPSLPPSLRWLATHVLWCLEWWSSMICAEMMGSSSPYPYLRSGSVKMLALGAALLTARRAAVVVRRRIAIIFQRQLRPGWLGCFAEVTKLRLVNHRTFEIITMDR